MAGTRTISLVIKVDGKDQITDVTQKIKSVDKASKKAAKSQNELKRNMEGTYNRANRGAKDFSRMSQGMGGLVGAYATVAANVYALSAAFDVLKRSADFSSMIKSTEDLAAATGRNFALIAKDLQKLSGGALNLAESLEAANRIASTGADTSQIKSLVTIATKASQTFGGTTTDTLNRFIGAVQRGRTELVALSGIVVKMDRALADYAASIGRTVPSLSEFERQQAITNAIIQEGNRLLGDVEIDPNPYETLGAAFQDLGREFTEMIRMLGTDNIAILIRDIKLLAVVIGGLVAKSIITKAIPVLEHFSEEMLKNADAAVAVANAKRQAWNEETKTLAENVDKQIALLKKREAAAAQKTIDKSAASQKVVASTRSNKTLDAFRAGFKDSTGAVDVKAIGLAHGQVQKAINKSGRVMKEFGELTQAELKEILLARRVEQTDEKI